MKTTHTIKSPDKIHAVAEHLFETETAKDIWYDTFIECGDYMTVILDWDTMTFKLEKKK